MNDLKRKEVAKKLFFLVELLNRCMYLHTVTVLKEAQSLASDESKLPA